MKYRLYEILDDPTYVDEYCVDLLPGVACYPTVEQQERIFPMVNDAVDKFNATSLGQRVFFKTDDDRQKFLTWSVLRWT